MPIIRNQLLQLFVFITLLLYQPGSAHAQLINEIVVNPNGSDTNCEYIEIRGMPGAALTGLWFASVEGDSTSNEGTFDFLVDLDAVSLGSNGFLVITAMDTMGVCGARDYGTPETTLLRDVGMDGGRLENGSNSFLLISSMDVLTEATDYDVDDNGTLEALPPGAQIIDAVAWIDGGAADVVYGSVSLPATAGGTNDMATRFPGNDAANSMTSWYHGDMDGTADSVNYDLTQVSANFPDGGMLTPGTTNAPVPNDNPVINEIVVNPNGSDTNCEYIEFRGMPGTALTDLWFASVEGDSTSNEGTFDFVVSLGSESLGSNGLLVITAMDTVGVCGTRDYGTPATTLIRDADMDGGRLENGTNSYLLIRSSGMIVEGTDYDTDDDGTLESLPGDAEILDSVGWSDGGAADVVYGSVSLPATAGGTNDMATRFPGDDAASSITSWYHGDMDGLANSVNYDLTQVSANFPSGGMLTPGNLNAPNVEIFSDGFED